MKVEEHMLALGHIYRPVNSNTQQGRSTYMYEYSSMTEPHVTSEKSAIPAKSAQKATDVLKELV